MKPEIKQKWTAALRSGRYLQGKQRLQHDGKFCALGVLCALFGRVPRGGIIPDHILKWSGLKYGEARAVESLNDRHEESFDQIANFIEGEL